MKKIIAEIIFSVKYEMKPENYPKESTPKECLSIDISNVRNNPEMLILDDNLQIKGRIIEGY